jgi:hypothetical protein
MLDMLSRWLVQQAPHMVAIAAVNWALGVLCRATVLRTAPRSNVFWGPAVLRLVHAGWERGGPAEHAQANIRVEAIASSLVAPLVRALLS